MMHHQAARQVFRYRSVEAGVTVEMVVWSLPKPSAERPHGLKSGCIAAAAGVASSATTTRPAKAITGTTAIGKRPTALCRWKSC
jgi:hypothetical protein